MSSRFGVQGTGNHQHTRIILHVALGMGQAANTVWSGQTAGQHGIKYTTPPPSFLGRDGWQVQMCVYVANSAHVAKYLKSNKAELPRRVNGVHAHMDGVLRRKLAFKQQLRERVFNALLYGAL